VTSDRGASGIAIDVHLSPDDLRRQLEDDVRHGLTGHPKRLPPVWFYDERGSRLFDEITRLPEYYLTRAERSILEAHASDVAKAAPAETLVELGSGTSEKTRLLIGALSEIGLRRFVPFDVSEATLREAAISIAHEHPGLEVHAVVGDFHRHLDRVPSDGTSIVAFLGSTIGNLTPAQRGRFLFDVDAALRAGEWFLLGADLVKDAGRLKAAYDDGAGVSAEFNKNVLHVMNRELGAHFDSDTFRHVARWNAEKSWMEMRLRSESDQVVTIEALDLDVPFEAGEDILTEISAKFTEEGLARELRSAGLEVVEAWTDDDDDFLVVLSTPFC